MTSEHSFGPVTDYMQGLPDWEKNTQVRRIITAFGREAKIILAESDGGVPTLERRPGGTGDILETIKLSRAPAPGGNQDLLSFEMQQVGLGNPADILTAEMEQRISTLRGQLAQVIAGEQHVTGI